MLVHNEVRVSAAKLPRKEAAHSIVVISGSPSQSSKTAKLADLVTERFRQSGVSSVHLRIRDLNAEGLLRGNVSEPSIAAAIVSVRDATGLVIITPTFKASFSGLLKAFLDILPQFGLTGKLVLPLAVGGSLAHVLVLDYGLRPVLQSMMPKHVLQGYYLLDSWITSSADRLEIIPDKEEPLLRAIAELAAHAPSPAPVSVRPDAA